MTHSPVVKLVALSLALCFAVTVVRAGETKCRIIDTADTPVEGAGDVIKGGRGLWEVCQIGSYEVWVSMDPADQDLLVMKEDAPVVSVGPENVLVFENGWKILTSVADRDADGVYEWIDYRTRGPSETTEHEIWDADRDGCADLRLTTQPTGQRLTEVKFLGRWLELTQRGNRYGYIHDEVFQEMSSALGEAFDQAISECVAQSSGTAN